MKTPSKLTALVVAAALTLVACGASDGQADEPSSTTTADGGSETTEASGGGGGGDAITIKDYAYDPEPLEVEAGATVTFTNEDGDTHTATSTGDVPKDFDTGDLGEGDAKDITFDEAGTYTYYCSIHQYMKGEVDVK